MTHRRTRGTAGFSLIELMVVVVIIGLLASIAIPAFMKYMANAKTTEARIQVEKIAMGARAYFLDNFAGTGLTVIERQFPASVPVTPAITCCAVSGGKCIPGDPGWTDPTWIALSYGMDDPHLYRYQFISSGTSKDATFTARALGDLDCDGRLSTFEMYGAVGPGGEPASSGGLTRIQQLE